MLEYLSPSEETVVSVECILLNIKGTMELENLSCQPS